MSGWTEREVNNVKMVHHSTSSQIEITIKSLDPEETGPAKEVSTTIWLDYCNFDDLKTCFELTCDCED